MSDPINCCQGIKETDSHSTTCRYWCFNCGRRKGVGCNCDLSFAMRAGSISIDYAALKRFHEGK